MTGGQRSNGSSTCKCGGPESTARALLDFRCSSHRSPSSLLWLSIVRKLCKLHCSFQTVVAAAEAKSGFRVHGFQKFTAASGGKSCAGGQKSSQMRLTHVSLQEIAGRDTENLRTQNRSSKTPKNGPVKRLKLWASAVIGLRAFGIRGLAPGSFVQLLDISDVPHTVCGFVEEGRSVGCTNDSRWSSGSRKHHSGFAPFPSARS